MVRAKFLSTKGPYLEAFIEVQGQRLCVMDEFGVNANAIPKENSDIYFEFTTELDESESWDSIFSGNTSKIIGIKNINSWSYRAFGKIVQIKPTIVDCGFLQVDSVISTNDDRVIGEYVVFTISRLGGYLHSIE